MSLQKSAHIAILALAGSLLLVGCDGDLTADAQGGSTQSASSSAGGASSVPSAGSGQSSSTGGSSGKASTSSGSTGKSSGDSEGEVLPPDGYNDGDGHGNSRCHTHDLAFKTVSSTVAGQEEVSVALTNKSAATCTLKGFPGINLLSASGSWSLTRSAETPKTATLGTGKTAYFTITYLPFEGDGKEFRAASIVVTPPDETTSATLDWPGDSLMRQDAATHPGTFVGPIGS
ncbi:DUF4232 domain-containing protein [Streptomyces sp900105245]|uniref:DUF4232 domain-containing protein n=1 Tax=Streptomyces sp. 900105245 TaxID=3154379 RepID=A0ABV1ULJ0_9ACTN